MYKYIPELNYIRCPNCKEYYAIEILVLSYPDFIFDGFIGFCLKCNTHFNTDNNQKEKNPIKHF